MRVGLGLSLGEITRRQETVRVRDLTTGIISAIPFLGVRMWHACPRRLGTMASAVQAAVYCATMPGQLFARVDPGASWYVRCGVVESPERLYNLYTCVRTHATLVTRSET